MERSLREVGCPKSPQILTKTIMSDLLHLLYLVLKIDKR